VNMPFSYEKIIKAQNGSSLVLTIDSYIQYVAEKYLSAAIEENLVANRGVSIVMNVKTGAILAMAIKGDFNPNTPFALSEADNELLTGLEGEERSNLLTELRNKQWRNKAVSDSYEPGSVFKIITASAALEENVTNLNNKYNCPGYIVVAGQHYNCHKHSGHGVQNLNQGISNSCNPVFITLGSLLGSKLFSKYFEAFGLTQKTGIDLPGEVSSIYHAESAMGPVELASSSFGQTFSITPVQLISAVAAAVNGGYLVKPHMVSKVLDAYGNIKSTTTTTVKRQVISAETSKKMCEMLENSVVSGGAKNAYVAGYKIGGKTGTSQKIAQMNATGQDNLYVGSFCGIAPMDNPEIAVLVLLDEPKGSKYYGGVISAPVGGQILSEVLPYLGYEPQYSEEELNKLFVKVPDVASDTVEAAKQKIKTSGLSYKIVGDGETIEKQVPAANSSVSKNGLVVLYTEGSEKTETKVPNFSGMTMAAVNDAAINAGINVEFSGNAQSGGAVIAYTQSIAAETTVDYGTVVTVFFRDNSSADYATN
ncbi:MAG: penicillin-binding transpeptidase domain-containing protein, partial [Acutalibacteraceae bacterium]|nr:penicillin-binding transpeptidase domain-containing protein [Acutalibacteraceae bacterium]